jgi:Family of unknown function (DUF5681)
MQFRPGQSGNKRGRPRTSDLPLGELLRKLVNNPRTKSALAKRLIKIANSTESDAQSLKAIALIFDQIEGKPAAKAPTKGDGKVQVIFGDESNDKTTAAA